MKTIKRLLSITCGCFLILLLGSLLAQTGPQAVVQGYFKDTTDKPLGGVIGVGVLDSGDNPFRKGLGNALATRRQANSDTNGFYMIEVPAQTNIVLMAQIDGGTYFVMRQANFAPSTTNRVDFVLTLGQSNSVLGHVTVAAQLPTEDLGIYIYDASLTAGVWDVISKGDTNDYSFANFPSGNYEVRVEGDTAFTPASSIKAVTLPASGSVELNFDLQPQ